MDPSDLDPKPLENASALHPRFYIGAEMDRLDAAHVIAPSWQFAGHVSSLAAPGDHLTLDIAGRPVFLVRGAEGKVRGFYNICRHRAGRIVSETTDGVAARGAERFRCQYHGWVYGLDGQLQRAPEMGEARDFDPSCIRLGEIAVAEWQGWLFVSLNAAPPPFETLVEGIAERIQPIDMGHMVFHHRVTYGVAANWKIYVDNYLEGYHVPWVHPGLGQVLDYRAYTTELGEHFSLQTSPVSNNDGIYGDGDAFYYFLYPNTMLNIMTDRVQMNRVIPDGPGACKVEFDFYYAPSEEALARAAEDNAFSDEIQEEDRIVCEAVQTRLASGAYEPGRLSPAREAGVWHFHNLLRGDYRRAGG